MDLGLDGRKALVLAASRGLGLGVATALVAEGAQVLVTGRDEGRLQRACERLNAAGPGQATYLAVDQSRPSSAQAIAQAAAARLGSVDILVNNTGGPPPGPIAGVASDVWAGQFDAMVRTVVDLTNAVLPNMRIRNWGRILTIASSGVVQPIPNLGSGPINFG